MNSDNKRKQQLDEITTKLEQGVKDVFSSTKYQEYLRVMSKFYQYSANNTLLIYMQRPDATRVGSYTFWKSMGRQVNKGEHGIQILCPAPYKYEKVKTDPITKQSVLDADGNPVIETAFFIRYKVGYTYDISQTSGKELPEIVHELSGSVEEYKLLMEAIQETSPVPITFENIPSSAKGYYNYEENRIAIQEGMSQEQTIKTAIHEVAHSLLDNKEAQAAKEQPVDRHDQEIRAESIAFCVCSRLGIDTSDYSFGYVASWSKDKSVKELTAYMDTIRTTAGQIIDHITQRLQEIAPEKAASQEKQKVEPVTEKTSINRSEYIPVYTQTSAYAREFGQMEQFQKSLKENIACKEAIEEAIRQNYDGIWLGQDVARPIIEQFGTERVTYVLATTVSVKDWDERFSSDNRQWAQTRAAKPDTDYFGYDRRNGFCVNSRSAVFDGFVNLTCRELEFREKTNDPQKQAAEKRPEKEQKRSRGRHR